MANPLIKSYSCKSCSWRRMHSMKLAKLGCQLRNNIDCVLIVRVSMFLSTVHSAEHRGRAKKISCLQSAFVATMRHTHRHTHQKHTQPELLTQPVLSSNLAKSLPIGLPSSEEVDRAVLPALDHLHSPCRKTRGQRSDSFGNVLQPPLRWLIPHHTDLSCLGSKLNELPPASTSVLSNIKAIWRC